MKIAVIGSGISGNLSARLLSTAHEVDLFESRSQVGGHARTVNVRAYGRSVKADVAFMVLNRKTYPNFCRMLEILGVATQASDMSLSVRDLDSGLEYQGSSLNGLFAQRRNLVRPSFHRMLRDILRFNRLALAFCDRGDEKTLLGEFVSDVGVSAEFRSHYLIPMSAAIWSADPACLDDFPAKFILGFMRNHGLLQLRDRPQWLTIDNRSEAYVSKLLKPLESRIHLNTPVREVTRDGDEVCLRFEEKAELRYDHVVLATHADQTLKLLADADSVERDVLQGFPYQENTAVLHTDDSLMPKRKRAWASWNYHIPSANANRVSVTYDLNRLQNLGLPGPLCLTLNPGSVNGDSCPSIGESDVLQRFNFSHPAFSLQSVDSQRRFHEVNAVRGVSFCGAYWGYGFHEDGVRSALAVASHFGLGLEDLNKSPTTSQKIDSATCSDHAGPQSASPAHG